jgi:hypothetical protein
MASGFAIVSDPFDDGDGIAVRATSGDDPEVRTLRLPIAILVGSRGSISETTSSETTRF